MPDKINKSKWRKGCWLDEPDEKKWLDKNGYRCVILRQALGHLCGYVGVEKGHSAWEKDYDLVDVGVHGGLTYSGFSAIEKDAKDLWYVGFDCAHLGDYVPGMPPHGAPADESYRDMQFVENEIRHLSEQLAETSQPQETTSV